MRATKPRMRLEHLESRAMLTTTVEFIPSSVQTVSNKVGTVDVALQLFSSDSTVPMPENITLATTPLIRNRERRRTEQRTKDRIQNEP